ncbi:hypothetical protein GINT2_001647 [Glugoides intestinalis]
MSNEVQKMRVEAFLEREVVVLLKDDPNVFLCGILKSYDQYDNITLNFAFKRAACEGMFSDSKLGLVVVRGENILLIFSGNVEVDNLKEVEYDFLIEKIKEIGV